MSQADASSDSGAAGRRGPGREPESAERTGESTGARAVRWAARSGALAGFAGVLGVLRGLRALRRGKRLRGIVTIGLGGGLLALARRQRRSGADRHGRDAVTDRSDGHAGPAVERDVEAERRDERAVPPTDVEDVPETDVTTETEAEPEIEDETEEGTEEQPEAEAERAGATEPDEEEVAYDRLGSAAIDGESGRLPAPQRAFNQGFLTLGAEAYWGVRESDDAVLVSDLYDPIQDAPGVRFLGSSEVGEDDRMLTVPDGVLDHWDSVAGGGTAVTGGDDLVFATSPSLQDDEQLLVVPEAWADDVLDEGAT